MITRIKGATIVLFTVLALFVAAQWQRIRYETRHWPSVWNLLAAAAGALTAGLIMLHAVGLLDDFIALFAQ